MKRYHKYANEIICNKSYNQLIPNHMAWVSGWIKRVVKTTGVQRHDDMTSRRYVITLWRYVFATHNDQIQVFFCKTLW